MNAEQSPPEFIEQARPIIEPTRRGIGISR
jgi:hypothetical protein